MNKSKFLKKSLATLLAILMVVAMIPLSAAAADSIDRISINGEPVSIDGDTFKADLVKGGSVTLGVAENYLVDDDVLYVAKGDTVYNVDEINATTNTLALANAVLADWDIDDSDATVTIELRLTDADYDYEDASTYVVYYVVLTVVTPETYVGIENVEAVPNTGAYNIVSWDDESVQVEVSEATDITPEFTVTAAYNGTVAAGDNTTITAAGDVQITDVTVAKTSIKITSEDGTKTEEFVIDVTRVDSLVSFAVTGEDGVTVDADIDTDNDAIEVVLAPEAIEDYLGDPATELPVNFVVNGNINELTIADATPTDITISNGDAYDFAGLALDTDWTGTVKVPVTYGAAGAVEKSQTYDLTVSIAKSNDTEITAVVMDDFVAEVDAEAGTVHAVLPVGTGLTDVVVEVTTAAANVEGGATGTSWTHSGNVWTITMDLSQGKLVTVTADDDTKQVYTFTAEISDVTTPAKLNNLVLKDGDNVYEPIKWTETSVTIEVPYMTTDVTGWKVYATPVAGAAAYATGNPIINGTTTAAALGFTAWTDDADISGSLTVANINDNSNSTTYEVIITLADYKMGKTLKGDVDVTVQDIPATPTPKNYKLFDAISDSNSFAGKVDATDKTVTYDLPYTLYEGLAADGKLILTDYATNNGGVAYLGDYDAANDKFTSLEPLSVLPNDKEDFASTVLAADKYIVVLPEQLARSYAISADLDVTNGVNENLVSLTKYEIVVNQLAPSNKAKLESFSVKGAAMKISRDNVISGEIPFSATNDDIFAEFVISDYAKAEINSTEIFSNGNDDPISTTNPAFYFEQVADNGVDVYNATAADTKDTAVTELVVTAEDGATKYTYTFDLTYAAANDGADITAFSLAGGKGVITEKNGVNTIDVTVPYGTNLKGQVVNFTTSPYATVTVASTGKELVSGTSTLDLTNSVTLLVTSESEKVTKEYTITAAEGMLFTDVSEDDWFYNDVLTAAANEWIKGITETTFGPYGDIKRGDFALIVARILGCDTEAVSGSSTFADVNTSNYYCTAINFCVEQGILSGFEDGEFKAEASITREQAAKILAIAMNLDCDSSVTATDFADDAKIADWAKMYVDACANAGIFKGDDQGNFNGTNNLTRAEAAAILVRAFA